jgi:hypothetical protein
VLPYYAGYVRNTILWGIAADGDSTNAPALLDYGLTTRWQDSFVPYAATVGFGGIPGEGSQYGRYQLRYLTIPLTTAALDGRDLSVLRRRVLARRRIGEQQLSR